MLAERFRGRLGVYKFVCFFTEWNALKKEARKRVLTLLGTSEVLMSERFRSWRFKVHH